MPKAYHIFRLVFGPSIQEFGSLYFFFFLKPGPTGNISHRCPIDLFFSQVVARHEDLLSQATGIESLEGKETYLLMLSS